jgi:hypothetical protein
MGKKIMGRKESSKRIFLELPKILVMFPRLMETNMVSNAGLSSEIEARSFRAARFVITWSGFESLSRHHASVDPRACRLALRGAHALGGQSAYAGRPMRFSIFRLLLRCGSRHSSPLVAPAPPHHTNAISTPTRNVLESKVLIPQELPSRRPVPPTRPGPRSCREGVAEH